jgi:hypothetical protein
VVARTLELKRFWGDGERSLLYGGRTTAPRRETVNRRTGGNLNRESIVLSDKECINEIGVARALGVAATAGQRDDFHQTGQLTGPVRFGGDCLTASKPQGVVGRRRQKPLAKWIRKK